MKAWPWYKRLFVKPTFDELVAICDYPHEVCWYVKKWVAPVEDPPYFDSWRPARVTWDIGKGDCEDLAVLVWEATHAACPGMICDVDLYFTVAPPKTHAVVQGSGWFSDNGEYFLSGLEEDAEVEMSVTRSHVSKEWFGGSRVFWRRVSTDEIMSLVRKS